MKIKATILPLIFALLVATGATAQFSNMVVFTQANEPFTVILNGVQQSPDPETNVKITGLAAPNYKLSVLFENKTIPEISKTVYLEREVEVAYEVLKNKKGLWVLRMLSSTPLDEISEPATGQDIYVFTTTPRLSTTTVSQTTTVSTGGLLGGVAVTTTTTQTTSNTGGMDDLDPHHNDQGGHNEYNDYDDRTEYNDYKGPRGCQRPMSRQSFDQAVQSISDKTFESSKLTIAKQIIAANCLLCRQVKDLMKLFTFESSRLELAKYAYKYTWDINNYYMLNDAFEFESSIDDLNKFINGRK
jgi:hypothetical protein